MKLLITFIKRLPETIAMTFVVSMVLAYFISLLYVGLIDSNYINIFYRTFIIVLIVFGIWNFYIAKDDCKK